MLQLLQIASLRVTIIAMAVQGQQVPVYNATETESTLLAAFALPENTTISCPNSARAVTRAATIAL